MSKIDDLIGRVAAGSAPSPQVIRAYHGSPYDFDRFDASKIGTGEGAQSYGHGLYFAGNERVASEYRSRLSGAEWPVVGADVTVPKEWGEAIAAGVPVDTGDLERALVEYRSIRPSAYVSAGVIADEIDRIEKTLAGLRKVQQGHFVRRPGHMYEVEIGYPEDSLLDWDRPLQSQGVAVGESLAPFRTSKYELGPDADYEIGATAVERIASAFDGDMGEASAALRKAGIPGIKYWDAGSRSAHQGTRNYVMFPGTEDQIRILRKYAVPGVVGTGAAAMSGGPDE